MAASLVAGACGGAATKPVEPFGDTTRARPSTTAPAGTGRSGTDQPGTGPTGSRAAAPPDVTSPAPQGDSPAPSAATASDRSTWSSAATTVDDVLVRFDRVVTQFHSDPSVFQRTADPLLAQWAAVVPPGAVLADDIRTQILRRLSAGESIPSNGDQLAYVHHVTSATPETPDRIRFTWCSWSPGIVVRTATGEVVDDVVGNSTGTGLVDRIGGTWMLSSLDELTYEGLPAGSTDPCPTTPTGGVAS